MNESILASVKNLLGIAKEDEAFDQDILVFINSTFSTLGQIGVEISNYHITKVETWDEIFSQVPKLIDYIKTYTYMKVRLAFDPPTSSIVFDSLTKQVNELEWRIYIEADTVDKDESDDSDKNQNDSSIPNQEIIDMWNKEK